MTSVHNRCKCQTRAGVPCQGLALEDGYCFSHSPSLEKKRIEARAKGGRNGAKSARLRGLRPPRLMAVYDCLEEALQEAHEGKLNPQQASAMASVARAMVTVLRSGELEERVRNLEEKTDRGTKK